MSFRTDHPTPLAPPAHPRNRSRTVSILLASILLTGTLFATPHPAHAELTEPTPGPQDSQLSVVVPPTTAEVPLPPPAEGGPANPPPAGGSSGNENDTSPPSPQALCTPEEPAVPTRPATTGETAAIDKAVYLEGDNIVATATGFGAGEQVQFVLFNDPAIVGSLAADADGAVRAEVPVPKELLPGTHTLQFTGWCDRVALADVLIGKDGALAATGLQGAPAWLWWVLGALPLIALVAAGIRIVKVMKRPEIGPATA